MLLLTYKLNRETKTQSEVPGTPQKSWDNKSYTATIFIHRNHSTAGIRGSMCSTWRITTYSPSDESKYHHLDAPCIVTDNPHVIADDTSIEESEGYTQIFLIP